MKLIQVFATVGFFAVMLVLLGLITGCTRYSVTENFEIIGYSCIENRFGSLGKANYIVMSCATRAECEKVCAEQSKRQVAP